MKALISITIFLSFLFAANTYAQKGDLVLSFSAKDATTNNPIPLESVCIKNLTKDCDTTIFGEAPFLYIFWPSGIYESTLSDNATFELEPNFPNPFSGTTMVKIHLKNREKLKIALLGANGSIVTELEKDLSYGTHLFEIVTGNDKLYLMSVSNGNTTKTSKLLCTNAGDVSTPVIKYAGIENSDGFKSQEEITAFAFQPGDMLQYTVHASGYYEYTSFDNPAENQNYTFDLQAQNIANLPTVTTASVSEIASTSATCGGNVTDQGGAEVTARGVCWSTSQNPSIANDHSEDGSGLGAFSSNISNLTINTNYYVRAYATNSFGTSYGAQLSFLTMEPGNIYTEIHENFDEIIHNVNIELADWKNIAFSGTRKWHGIISSSNKYAQATAYNSSDIENTMWLITPMIDFDANENAILSFKSAHENWTHECTTVWLVQNLIGNEINNATKTPISCTLADENTPDNQWVYTGTVDLSNYSGICRIGFKYYGSQATGQTTIFRIDDVEISPSTCGQPFVDERDGNTYNTVLIGDQCWMKENLAYLPSVSPSSEYSYTEPYYYVYDYQGTSTTSAKNTINYSTYGVLYNWPASLITCPEGWHLPSDPEWTSMIDYLGGLEIAGGKLKETGTSHWTYPNTGASNSSGFSGLPGGYRHNAGIFCGLGGVGMWWSSTEGSASWNSYHFFINHDYSKVIRVDAMRFLGNSVRCIRTDSPPSNQPPAIPSNPNPPSNATNQQVDITLTWFCSDPENDPLSYDLYLGTNNPPPLIQSGISNTSYALNQLQLSTTYYWKIVARDDHENITEGSVWSFTTSSTWQCGIPFVDTRDGQEYNTVQIGTQCWMAENLNIGTRINISNDQTNNGTIEKYCYDNTENNCDIYGGLYQWQEMMHYSTTPGTQGICPSGWHLPTDEEWCTLEQEIDPTIDCYEPMLRGTDGGGKMKEAGTMHWNTPNTGATNSSGFSALAGGGYNANDGVFTSLGNYCFLWSSYRSSETIAWMRYLSNESALAGRYVIDIYNGYSVRCVKGSSLSFNDITIDDIINYGLSSEDINGSNNSSNQLLQGAIILYKTNEGRYGKFIVQQYGMSLTIKWVTYNNNGSIFSNGENLTISASWTCDLDIGVQGGNEEDFWWNHINSVERYLTPMNGALFGIYN